LEATFGVKAGLLDKKEGIESTKQILLGAARKGGINLFDNVEAR
jgi:hypothetical protein